MNALLGVAEVLVGILEDLLTIPMLILGFLVGMRGSVCHFNMKAL